jgi:hypothetical protein
MDDRRDERSMLVGLARAYVEAQRRFGQVDQPTFMKFPSIQGFRMRKAVEELAAIGDGLDLKVIEPDGVVARCREEFP